MQRAVIAFALLAGTDLTPGMPGIGVERAETFLKYCQQQRTVRLGRGHEAGEDALDTLHKHRSGGGGDTGGVVGSAETKRVVAAVARHCAYFHSPRGRRAGARISRHPDAAPQLSWHEPSPEAMRYVNAATCVHGQRKHTSWEWLGRSLARDAAAEKCV